MSDATLLHGTNFGAYLTLLDKIQLLAIIRFMEGRSPRHRLSFLCFASSVFPGPKLLAQDLLGRQVNLPFPMSLDKSRA